MPRVVRKATTKAADRALTEGYRSGLEGKVADQLKGAGVPALYERFRLSYTVPAREAKYTPDFVLHNGIIVETKGRFVTEDRTKHRLIKDQHPDLDIRLVFSNPNALIRKNSPTSYAMWCERNGIPYAAKLIPREWLLEAASPTAIAAAHRLLTEVGVPVKKATDKR